MAGNAGKMESYRELEQDPESYYAVWKRELEAAKKHYERFVEVSDRILTRYRDERADASAPLVGGQRLNFFWSNTQVLRSTLYTKPPKVDVARLYRDYADDVARVAGIIIERLLNHDLEKDTADFDVAVRQAIDDWLIIGEGMVWYRYEVATEQVPAPPDPVTGIAPVDEKGQPVMTERITSEDALSDYVYWRDFLCSPARTWQEVRWVGRRVQMTRDALVDRFGEDMGKQVPLKSRKWNTNDTAAASEDDPWATAEVWEIWCKTNRRVYWCVVGFEKFLDCRADPLELDGFFPCPEPMLANKTNNTLIPRADYSMARDQYTQIDQIVTRLHLLVDACKVRGAYDKESAPQLGNILQGSENKMVPVDNWALFGEKGGLKGVMDWVPIDMVVNVIQQLRAELAEQKQELYETLGIADIMRGATRATETATAQQIKAQFGSVRLQFKQFEVARFVRDAQRIKAEIIVKHYQPETMIERSNIMQTPDKQFVQPAIELLKSGGMAQYRLQIQPDSMAALDWAAERDARTQFLQAVGGFIQQSMPLMQAKPEATPFLLQLLQWGLSGFKVGKEIEGVIDQAIQGMQQKQGPTPEEARAKEAGVAKTESETMRNKAGAAKDLSQAEKSATETAGIKMQTMNEATIMQGLTQQPAGPSERDSYLQ